MSEITPSRLPSGRHNLPREFVVTSQRDRLLDSMAQACAEKRYAGRYRCGSMRKTSSVRLLAKASDVFVV